MRPPRATRLAAILALTAAPPFGCGWSGRERPEGGAVIYLEPAGAAADLMGDRVSTKMRAFSADVPSTSSWRFQVPAGGWLETHLSFASSMVADLAALVCRVRVEVATEDGTTRVLLEREVRPGGEWEPYLAELAAYGGRTVDLRLSVGCPSADPGRRWPGAARWSVPVVAPARSGPDKNLVLVSIDTLRPDHLHAYGYPRETSPHLDRLAGRGLLFRNAETVQSATWPALTSLHTSLYPSSHGVIWNGQDPSEDLVTLAEVLRQKGYSTSAFLANMRRRHRGFSRIFMSRRGGDQALEDRIAVEEAIRQLHRERRRPFFLWLHLLSPHAPYTPPPPYDTAFTRPGASSVSAGIEALALVREKNLPLTEGDLAHVVGLYDGEVAWVDELVGRLLAALRELDLEENTLVALTADHGEDLYEHNRYFFHSPSIYGSSIRIPLILALPGVLPEGVVTDHPASLVDVAPTVLGLLGIPSLPQFQGQDLLPRRALPARPVRTTAFSETHGTIYALSTAEWRFIYNPGKLHPAAPGGPYPIGEVELYRLPDDPREQRNLAPSRPDLVRVLTGEVVAWKTRYAGGQRPQRDVDPQTAEELRALGYVVQ